MTQQLENDLRDAFAARAAELPAGVADRLRDRDYRPRVRSVRPRAALGALGAVGVAAVVASIVGLGTGTPEAFAGWTPSPTRAGAGQIATATTACRQRLATVPSPPASAGAPAAGAVLAGPMSPVLTDTRGPFTFVILAGARGSASCITGPSFTALSGTASTRPQTVPAGQVVLMSSHATDRAGHAYSFAEGHTGAGVTGATLILDDGTHVQATLSDGWFVAWWPSSHDVSSAELTTTTGTTTQKIDNSTATPCPAGARCGATSMSGAGSFGMGVRVGSMGFSTGRVTASSRSAGPTP